MRESASGSSDKFLEYYELNQNEKIPQKAIDEIREIREIEEKEYYELATLDPINFDIPTVSNSNLNKYNIKDDNYERNDFYEYIILREILAVAKELFIEATMNDYSIFPIALMDNFENIVIHR